MTSLAPLPFAQGETIRLYIEMTEGDTADVAGLPAATLTKAAPDCTGAMTPDPAFTPIPFFVETGTSPPLLAGWWATIDAAVSATLAPGIYLADVAMTIGGDVIRGEDYRKIRIREAV